MNHKFASQGITLIEAMVAMMILAIISSAIIMLTLQVLSLTNSAKLKNQGTSYAEQLNEKIRDLYQQYGYSRIKLSGCLTPNLIAASNNSLCVDDCSNFSSSSELKIQDTNYYGYVLLASNNSSVKVTNIVTWKDKGNCRKSQVDTYYYQ